MTLTHHCLNREQTTSVLLAIHKKDNSVLHDTIKPMWDSARCYSHQLSILTYFVCHALEGIMKKEKINVSALIDRLYSLKDTMLLTIQEIDLKFLELMFTHPRHEKDLAGTLEELQCFLIDHQYGKALR